MRFSNIDALGCASIEPCWGRREPRHRDHARTRNAPGPPWAALLRGAN
jgi:hypothetical protein